MKILKSLGFAAVVMATSLSATLTPTAFAQANEQFFPVHVYRTGPYGPNGAEVANGHIDYLKLVNARGGINGAKVSFEECEFGYATDRGVECYQRLKDKNGGATLFQPLSTGVTFALTDKVDSDKIPLLTVGYGRSESADGGIFKWNFPLVGSHVVAGDIQIQHIAKLEGGFDKLNGKKIALLYHDSPYGKEPIPLLQERAKMHGFELMLLPVPHPGIEQRSAWLQIRQQRPDYVLLWGWGIMNVAALKEAVSTGYPRGHVLGNWWTGSEPDVKDVGEAAKGYSSLMLGHGAHPDAKVVKDILTLVHDKGQGTGPRSGVGSVLYMRGVINAMLGVEAVRRAQERFGKGKVMTGEQTRWGLENLALDQKKLDALGFAGVMRPMSTSCFDHMGWGNPMARVHTWDGSKWSITSDWYQPDEALLKPLLKSMADKYAAEKKITRRSPQDCQS